MLTLNGANGGAPILCPVALYDGHDGPIEPGTVRQEFAAQSTGGAVVLVTRTIQPNGDLSAPEIHLLAEGKDVLIPGDLARRLSVTGETSTDRGTRRFGRLFTAAVGLADRISSTTSQTRETT